MQFNSTVEWGDGDFVTTEKLQAMVNNDLYLYRRIVDWGFRGLEQVPVVDTVNLKILSGVTVMGGVDEAVQSQEVSFGDFFSASCTPVVNATLATQDRVRTDVSIMGLDGSNNVSRDGMRIWIAHQLLPAADGGTESYTFQKQQRVHWVAIGW